MQSPHLKVISRQCAHSPAFYGECANDETHRLSQDQGDMISRVNVDSGRSGADEASLITARVL
jgi:hypothetical protein